MKRSSLLLLTVVAVLSLCGTASATDYFVATWGDNGWPGTIDQPFETITQGTQTAQAGDTVNVRAGDYAEGRLDFYRDGAPGAYITVQSYDGDLAAHVTDGIWVHARAYIKIIGMEVSNSTNVLHVDPGDNLVPRSQYVYIQRCYLHDSTGGDVFKANQSDYVYLEDSELQGPPGDELCDWVWTNYSECRRCYLHDYSGIGFTIKGGSLYCTLEDTVVSHAVDSASKATRFGGSTDSKYRNPDSDYATEYTVYRNNIIRDCTAPAGGSYECWYAYFYNNTVHNCGGPGDAIFTHHADPPATGDGGSRNLFFFNNVFLDTGGDMPIYVKDQSGKPYENWQNDNNNFYNAGNAIPTGGLFDPNQQANSTFGNPNLANPTGTATTYAGWLDCYRITASSAALIDEGNSNAGNDPRPAVHYDIEGTSRPQGSGWDIGAFELVSGPAAPVADFSGNPTNGVVPLTVYFSDLSSNSPTSWSWDFGDTGGSALENPSHEYTAANSYTVSLTATNAHGQDTETKVDYITVTSGGQAPVAEFIGTPTNGTVPLTVDFTDQSTNSPTSWSWDFGDTGGSGLENPSHEYTAVNSYTVSLTATNAYGQDTETKVDYITVTAAGQPPVAEFIGSPTNGTVPLTVDFTDQSTNSPTSWSWDFGDTGGSALQNPSHQYTTADTYTVSLTATNAEGQDTETKVDYITVNPSGGGDHYFVATWGDDGWPGTIDEPFETITQGTQTAQAGDTVNVRAGDYAEGRLDFYRDGAPGAPITVLSYDGDHAAHVTDGVWIHDRRYIRLEGMQISGATNSLHIDPSSDLSSRSAYIDVIRCWVHTPSSGDVLKANQSDYIEIQDCIIEGVSGDEQMDWVWVNYSAVRRTYFLDFGAYAFTMKGGSHYNVLEDCVISNGAGSFARATRFGGSTDTQYQDPTTDYASEFGVYRNNIMREAPDGATGTYECWYAYFYNNTVHNCGADGGRGIVVHHMDPPATGDGGSRHLFFFNNVFMDTDGDMGEVYEDQSGKPYEDWQHDSNSYWNNGNPIPSEGLFDPNLEADSTFGNPNLANPTGTATTYAGWLDCYRITSSSTLLIDQGSNTAGNDPQPAVHYDIEGTSRPQGSGWDIGAFEYGGGGPLPPVANFSGNPTNGDAPLTVNFSDLSTNTPTSWSWDFGDTGTSTAQNPSHDYTSAGDYTVSLTATNAAGSDGETKTNYISVTTPPPAPVAEFSGSPTSGDYPLTVNFTDLSTNSPTSWSWDFGDSGTSTAQNPSHDYTSAGDYTVSLTATNAGGSDSETKTDYISVSTPPPPAPVAEFSGSPTSGQVPLTVNFTDLSTNTPTSWSWDFGDTGSSGLENPSHEYTAVNTYTVALTATNSYGQDTETKVDYITVTSAGEPPVADFIGNPTNGTVPLTVNFTDQSTNSPTSWSWDFGDTGSSTAQNPSHQYTSAGDYTVSLTATNAGGSDSETKVDYISVSTPPPPAPVAEFSGTPTSGDAPLTVNFTDLSTNSPTSWSWDFGDTGGSGLENPSHDYTSAGDYTVSLTATNAGGSDSETKVDYISVSTPPPPAPVAEFSGTPTSGDAPLTVNFTDASTNSPTSWSWDFGDTGSSSAQNPSHEYTTADTYTVSLTATNAGGSDSETKVDYITVNPSGGGDYFCDSISVAGTVLSGDYTSVHASDDSYLVVESKKLSGKQTSYVTYYFNTGLSSLSSLTVTVELHPSLAPQTQKIRIYDFSSGSFDEVDARSITTTTDTTTVLNIANPAPYLSATGEVRVLVRTGDVTRTVWTCHTDYVKITAAP